jgi:gamma-glutamylputrescine oxidase
VLPAWDDDPIVAAWNGLPPLASDVSADACVVGLGASGLTAIDDLVARGLDVVGIDAGRVAAGAAGRNGGFLLGGPATFLHTALREWGPIAVDLYRETLRELDRIDATLGPGIVHRTGSIRLAGLPGQLDRISDSDEWNDCRALSRCLTEHGIAVSDYDGDLGRGIFLPDDAAVNPARRAIAMATTLREKSRLFEHSPVTSISSGRVDTVHGSVSAPIVLVAVDGKIEQLLPTLHGRVRTARLQMAATEPVLPVRLPCPVYGRWGYDYAQQTPDGRLFVGGGRDKYVDSEWTYDDEPTDEVQRYIDTVAAAMAGRPVKARTRWAASVGFTDDGRPLCTEVDAGVMAMGGYNGTGNLVGPIAARAAVAALIDGTPVPGWFAA